MERLFSKELKLFQFLKVLGDHSYSTYLNHTIIIGWFYYLNNEISSNSGNVISVTSIIISVLIISKLSYDHIETSKYISMLKSFSIMFVNKKIALFR